jgi:hypothetical protein
MYLLIQQEVCYFLIWLKQSKVGLIGFKKCGAASTSAKRGSFWSFSLKPSRGRVMAGLTLGTLLVCLLSAAFMVSVNAQNTSSPSTVALWHLDDVKPSGDYQATSDSAGCNNGLFAGDPVPVLVSGQFEKAISFNGLNAIYVPVSFWVGFLPRLNPYMCLFLLA